MNRRESIKSISLALGYSIAMPSLLSIISSCTNNNSWKPLFVNKTQKYILDYLVDIIIPKSEYKPTTYLSLTIFVDEMLMNTNTPEELELFNLGSLAFSNKFETVYKKNALKGNKKEYQKLLDTYFRVSKDDQNNIFKLLESNLDQVPNDKKEIYSIYKFLTIIRQHCLIGYYTSQKVMEDDFGYQAVPGSYQGCINL